MFNPSRIADVFEVTLSTAVERVSVQPGQRIQVYSSVATAILFGDNTGTPSLTPQVAAAGTLTSDDVFLATETVTIDGQVYTFRASLTNGGLANEVLIGVNQTASHLNLQSAINGLQSGRGTTYGAPTVAHASVWGSAVSGTTTVVRAKRGGANGNLIATTETCGHAAWGAAVLASGAGAYGQIALAAGQAREFIVPARTPGDQVTGKAVTSLAAIAGGAGTFTVIVLA